jgi:hypothetical protein
MNNCGDFPSTSIHKCATPGNKALVINQFGRVDIIMSRRYLELFDISSRTTLLV